MWRCVQLSKGVNKGMLFHDLGANKKNVVRVKSRKRNKVLLGK